MVVSVRDRQLVVNVVDWRRGDGENKAKLHDLVKMLHVCRDTAENRWQQSDLYEDVFTAHYNAHSGWSDTASLDSFEPIYNRLDLRLASVDKVACVYSTTFKQPRLCVYVCVVL